MTVTREILERIIAGHEREANTPAHDAIIEQTVAAVRAFAVIAGVELDRDAAVVALFGSVLHQVVCIERGVDIDAPGGWKSAIDAMGWVQVALSRIAGAPT